MAVVGRVDESASSGHLIGCRVPCVPFLGQKLSIVLVTHLETLANGSGHWIGGSHKTSGDPPHLGLWTGYYAISSSHM